jgi:hypothetical protein
MVRYHRYRGFYFGSDESGGGGGTAGQAPNSSDKGDPSTNANGQEPGASNSQTQTYDENYVRRLREEAASHRKEAKDAKDKLKAIDDAQKSELQKANERAEAAEKRAAEYEAKQLVSASMDAIEGAAKAAMARNPRTVAKLLMADGVAGAETGKPDSSAVKSAIEALKKSDPHLFEQAGPKSGDAGGGNGSNATDMNGLIRSLQR